MTTHGDHAATAHRPATVTSYDGPIALGSEANNDAGLGLGRGVDVPADRRRCPDPNFWGRGPGY